MRISDWSSDVCSSDLAEEGEASTGVFGFTEEAAARTGGQASAAFVAERGVAAAGCGAAGGVDGELSGGLGVGHQVRELAAGGGAAGGGAHGHEIGRAS